MAGETEIGELRRGRRWMIASAVGVAGLMGLSIVVTEAGEERNDVVLSRSEVTQTAGGALWRGVLDNRAHDRLRDVSVEIRFLARDGRLLGEATGRTSALAAGGRLELEAALPPGAVQLQVYALRWRTGQASLELGPFRPRALTPLLA
jgi:hypothetical protein